MMKPSLTYYANILQSVKRRKKWESQQPLADALGVTPSQISRWLNPRSRRDIPGDDVLPKLAKLSGEKLNALRLHKYLLKMEEDGITVPTEMQGPTLTEDQRQVAELMAEGRYLDAAQFLLNTQRHAHTA